MYSTVLSDNDLLPVPEQIRMYSVTGQEEIAHNKCQALYRRLEHELNRNKLSMTEYLMLSTELVKLMRNQTHH